MNIFIVFILLISFSFSQEVGKVERYKGKVDLLKHNSLRGIALDKIEPVLGVGDILRTKRKSYAYVSFIDGSRVELFELTRLKVVDYVEEREVNVQRGVVKFEVESLHGVKGFRVKTPHALIGVKGTVFWVYVFPGFTRVVVEKGSVESVYLYQVKTESWEHETDAELYLREEPFSEKPPVEASANFIEVRLQ